MKIVRLFLLPNLVLNKFILSYKKVTVGKNLSIKGRLRLHGQGIIIINDNVKINSCESSNPIGGQTYTSFCAGKGAKLTIGNNTGISNSTIVCHNCITIGDNVKIGGNCKIYDTDFHSLDAKERINGEDRETTKPIIIKNGAFIGAHTVILKGVTIGENAVIGAGSVVAKDVPANEIWAGNPIKKIR